MPRKITAKTIYNRINRNLKKNSDYSKVKLDINDVLSKISNNKEIKRNLNTESKSFSNKYCDNPDDIVEGLPIQTLFDFYNSHNKLKYSDIVQLNTLQKKEEQRAAEMEVLLRKKKILEIELLEKKIDFILKEENNSDNK